jgi:glycosyltransferase involved in cell wall biosynthesis
LEPLYINGRFATQNLSGVQRFAQEIATALLRVTSDAQLLVPAGGAALQRGARETGHLQGQAWEQRELPHAARDGFLLNLGNTAPLLGRRQLVVIHDAGVFSTPEAYSWRFRAWYKFMQAWLVRRKVPIVTVSEFSRRELIRHLRVPAAQVAVMTEGADHALRIKPDTGILQKHELRDGQFVLAVGTLSAHKNLKALGALARHLAARNIPLVIAGSLGGGAFQPNKAAGLPQPARYIGRVSDEELKALYEHAGCFVFPSRYEGFGLPAVEAMACFCPVVAADIPALRETCGAAAHYADPTRPEEIAARALEILDDPALSARLRQAGAARTQTMTWDSAAAMLTTIIGRYRNPTP